MNTRLLAYFHEVRTPEAVRGENGQLLGFTKPFTDRGGQCCLEVTREQWTELQRHRWASPVMEIGFLIPDVDFVAQDGTVFQDAAECLAHERSLTVPAWKRALEDKRAGEPFDLCGNYERAGILELDRFVVGEETLIQLVNSYEQLTAYELADFGRIVTLLGTHPAFEFVQVPDVEAVDFYALPKYEVHDGAIVPQSEARENVDSSDPHKVASGGSTPPPDTAPAMGEKPLYSRAWDKLESKMRLGDLAAALEVDADTLKTALQDPESTVELGHAGWVKRREPKA